MSNIIIGFLAMVCSLMLYQVGLFGYAAAFVWIAIVMFWTARPTPPKRRRGTGTEPSHPKPPLGNTGIRPIKPQPAIRRPITKTPLIDIRKDDDYISFSHAPPRKECHLNKSVDPHNWSKPYER